MRNDGHSNRIISTNRTRFDFCFVTYPNFSIELSSFNTWQIFYDLNKKTNREHLFLLTWVSNFNIIFFPGKIQFNRISRVFFLIFVFSSKIKSESVDFIILTNNEFKCFDDFAEICGHSQQEWAAYSGWSNRQFYDLRQKTSLGSFDMGGKITKEVSNPLRWFFEKGKRFFLFRSFFFAIFFVCVWCFSIWVSIVICV